MIAYSCHCVGRASRVSLTILRVGILGDLLPPLRSRAPFFSSLLPHFLSLLLPGRPFYYSHAEVPLRRSLQLVNDLPFSQPEVGPDGEVEAAAVLAAMRRGQAQLRWATQEGDSNMSSDLQPPPPSPGVSSARPPRSAQPAMGGATRGIVLPPRRAATRTADAFTLPHQTGAAANGDVTLTGRAAAVVAGVRTPPGGGRARASGVVARPRRRGAAAIGGFSITRQAGMGATGGGTPPSRASGVTAARVVKPTRLASPPVGGRRVVGTPAASPSGGALTSARGLAARRESLGATGSTAAAPRTPAVRKGGTPPSGDSPVSVLDAALRGVQHTAAPVAPHGVARSVTVPPGSPSPVAAGGPPSSSAGAHRPSMCRAPVQANLTAAAPLPRALSFVVPERGLPDPAGQKSLTPSVAAAPPKAIKGIRKPTKPRARRGAKNATASPPPVQPAVSAGTPTAASQTGWTPIADPPPVHPVGERPIPTVVTVATMTKVFAEGLRPVCVHLAGLSQKLAEVHTSFNRLSTNLHSQGVGNERTAQAVVQLQGALKGVYEGVISHTKKEPVAATALRGSTAMLDNCEDQLELATINELEVGNVRDVAKKVMINEMLGAKESYRAMPNRVRALEILYDACLAVRGASQDEAVAYLCSQRVFLTTAGSPTEKRIRVSEKLYRISSHVVEALQKVAMVAYFKSLGESI